MIDRQMTVHEAIELMKREGNSLREPYPAPADDMPPFTYLCVFSDGRANLDELKALPCQCPQDLQDFWREVRTARLFEDQNYGQWGLEILDPFEAVGLTKQFRKERERDYVDGDFVVGRFFGDSDLLIVRCDPTATDFGKMMVALPIEPRADWDHVTDSFAAFLDKYAKSGGEKFWIQSVD